MHKRVGYTTYRMGSTVLSGVILLVVAAMLIVGVLLVRAKLLQNAQDMGTALARSYAMEEQSNLDALEKNVRLASQYVDEFSQESDDLTVVQNWMSDYFGKLIDTLGEGTIDPYAVIDGQIVAANPWEGDGDYAYAETDWYRNALAADGEVVCTDAYTDALTGQRVMTMSQALSTPGEVFAMDIYIQNPNMHQFLRELPQECSYYLCDQDGVLLYAVVERELDSARLQSHADYLMAGIEDGSLLAYNASFKDLNGVSRGAYYHQMRNGWTAIMTIPFNSILIGDQNLVIYLLTIIAVVSIAALMVVLVRDALQNRRVKKADDTAHMLGDSFYAIFRVNFRNGEYEAIKRYRDMQEALPLKGPYALLLQQMQRVVKSSTYQAFERGFSLDNIHQRAEQGVKDYGGDYQRLFGDTYRWVNIRTLYDPELSKDEVILCFRDVDEEKRQELQHTIILQEALDAAKKSTKAKSEFFSRMSHDMRTPLNGILGCCELAQKTTDSSKIPGYLSKIEFAGKQLLDLINDILELSRMEAGKSNLQEKNFDLGQLLESIADIFRVNAQAEGKHFQTRVEFQQTMVRGDSQKISQILNNLLSNAVKYSNPGDSIVLEARQFDFQQHSKYQIVVEDTGVGMSAGFLEHLFEPYSRETAFSAHNTVGTGLGMPIVKSLVQQMSGEISVESQLGKGTRFVVTIPLRAVCGESESQQPEKSGEEGEFAWDGRVVLLAEDNLLNREIATEILETLGAKVIAAEDGTEALRLFSESPLYSVDVILMDMQMPVMDGCQAASAIRGLDRADAASVPIIAVTANAFSEDIARTTQAGMNDHVAKPLDVAVLTQTMQRLIRERSHNGKASPEDGGNGGDNVDGKQA